MIEGLRKNYYAFSFHKYENDEEEFLELGVRQKQRTENSSFRLIGGLLHNAICCDNKRLLTAVSENKVDML